MTTLLVYGALSVALLLILPRRWFAALLAFGLACIGWYGMFVEHIPPNPVILAVGIAIFAGMFFLVLLGVIELRRRFTRKP